MTYRAVDSTDVEAWRGVMRRMRDALGVESVGINQLELPPHSDSHPEHDERRTNHDEIYICIEGSGTITVDGEAVALRPGTYVYVTPESRRKIAPGDEGVTCIIVGARADSPRGGWESL